MDSLTGSLMWSDGDGEHPKMDKLLFKTGDLFTFFQEHPLYFTATQVRRLIEHLAPQLKLWANELPQANAYVAFYDSCECDKQTMGDTVDSMYRFALKFKADENATPVDAWECTSFHALQISKICDAPGFLFDLSEEERPSDWDKTEECLIAVIKLLIVAAVNLKGDGFFTKLVGMTLPAPTSRYRVHIDNKTGYLNYAGTHMNPGRQVSLRPGIASDQREDEGSLRAAKRRKQQ